jgi:hypothetical protein
VRSAATVAILLTFPWANACASRAHSDCVCVQLLRWTPSAWADDYRGVWLDALSLLVTATAVPAAVPDGSSVGNLSVAVLPTGLLTSLDGTSAPSNSSTVVAAGSWGHVVCDAGAVVYSHTALAVAFEPPPGASYAAPGYTIQVSTSMDFPANASTRTMLLTPGGSLTTTVGLPPPWQPTALRYIVRELVPDTAYYVRVGAAPPALPAEVTAILLQAVPVVFSAVGEPGSGCSCTSVRAGTLCAAAPSQTASAFTPRRPVIGTCVREYGDAKSLGRDYRRQWRCICGAVHVALYARRCVGGVSTVTTRGQLACARVPLACEQKV